MKSEQKYLVTTSLLVTLPAAEGLGCKQRMLLLVHSGFYGDPSMAYQLFKPKFMCVSQCQVVSWREKVREKKEQYA